MPIRGPEPVLYALRDTLRDGLDAALTAIEAEWSGSDPVPIPRPKTNNWFIAQKRNIREFPTVMILVERVVHGWQTASYQWQTSDSGGGISMNVIYIDQHDNEEILRKKLYRVALAMCRILGEKFDLNQSVMMIQTKEEEYLPALGFLDRSGYQQAFRLRCLAQQEESYD